MSISAFEVFKKIFSSKGISILALIFSISSCYYAREADLRSLEQLTVSENGNLELDLNSPQFEISKSFKISNISDRQTSIKEIELDLQRPSQAYRTSFKVLFEGKDISHIDELNKILSPGESLIVTVKLEPSMGPRAREFLSKRNDRNNWQNLNSMCKDLGIDLYDNELSDVQRKLCPSFRNYKGANNPLFFPEGKNKADLIKLIVHTYRDNTFLSDKYSIEIGNSIL